MARTGSHLALLLALLTNSRLKYLRWLLRVIFLIPIFKKYLNNPEIIILKGHQNQDFRGLTLLGFFDVGMEASNEDDVMVLVHGYLAGGFVGKEKCITFL